MTTKIIAKKKMKLASKVAGANFFKHLWGESWTYVKTVVDVVEEPVLILDKDFRVFAANKSFYQTFHVKDKDTEGKILFKLGNGQWNIPKLRKLLGDILPKKTFFKGFEVSGKFPLIGQKIMILNARQLYLNENINLKQFLPIILLAIEDVTQIMATADKLADYTNGLENKLLERTEKLEACIERLEKEINEIKKKL